MVAEYSDADLLNQIAGLIDSGKVKPNIQQIFAFDEINQALALSQTKHVRGKRQSRLRIKHSTGNTVSDKR